MDKRVIFAVAGSGKTTYIIEELNEYTNSLLITFTVNNYNNLKIKIIDKFGYLPQNIRLYTYFTFLYSFCYKPFLLLKYRTKGISYKINENRYAQGTTRYIDKYQRLYSNRIAKFLEYNNIINEIIQRIEKYFDNVFIDEVQDFAGHDFNFLMNLAKANIEMLFVGDFYQHTYDTSRDGKVNFTLHDDYQVYKSRFENIGLVVDTTSLIRSYRCSPSVCDFITNNLGIEIHSNIDKDTNVSLLIEQDEINDVINSNEVVKLFYNKHYTYNLYSSNWGESKGIDNYEDVCVVLNNNSTISYQNGTLSSLKPISKNKLYVACSRARGNLYFLFEKTLREYINYRCT